MSVDRRGNDAQGAGACSPETIGSLSVAASKGNIAAGMREVSARNLFTKLRMDICERRSEEGSGAIDVRYETHGAWFRSKGRSKTTSSRE
jgi:hypothetical protein